MKQSRNAQRKSRARRIRARIVGTGEIPRVHVFRSLTGFSAQITDDVTGTTLASASLRDDTKSANTVAGVEDVATALAKKATAQKIAKVVFDRSGYKYHGKVKAFAEKLRSEGLIF